MDVEEMFLDWGLAELPNVVATWPPEVNSECQALRAIAGKIERLGILKPSDAERMLNEDERNKIRLFILRLRADILKYAIKSPTTWIEKQLAVSQAGGIVLLNVFKEQPETILDMLDLPDYHGMKWEEKFDANKVRGRPILLANTTAKDRGPYCLIEGTHRLYNLYLDYKLGKIADRSIDVIVGFADDIIDCRNRFHREGSR